MNQVEYTISLQRILAISAAISFFSLCLTFVFTSPYENLNYIWLAFILIWIILTSLFSLVGYWWVFSIKKQIISISQSNLVISKAAFLALSLIYLLNSYSSNALDILQVAVALILNFAFFTFINGYNN